MSTKIDHYFCKFVQNKTQSPNAKDQLKRRILIVDHRELVKKLSSSMQKNLFARIAKEATEGQISDHLFYKITNLTTENVNGQENLEVAGYWNGEKSDRSGNKPGKIIRLPVEMENKAEHSVPGSVSGTGSIIPDKIENETVNWPDKIENKTVNWYTTHSSRKNVARETLTFNQQVENLLNRWPLPWNVDTREGWQKALLYLSTPMLIAPWILMLLLIPIRAFYLTITESSQNKKLDMQDQMEQYSALYSQDVNSANYELMVLKNLADPKSEFYNQCQDAIGLNLKIQIQ